MVRTGSGVCLAHHGAHTIQPHRDAGCAVPGGFFFSNTKAADAAEIEARMREAMRRETGELFRGAFADTGIRMA